MKSLKHFLSLIVVIISMNFEKIHAYNEWREEIGYFWTDNCRFNTIKTPIETVLDAGKEECANYCRTTLGCTHYYWIKQHMKYDISQACFLRKDIVYKADVISNGDSSYPTSCGIVCQGN